MRLYTRLLYLGILALLTLALPRQASCSFLTTLHFDETSAVADNLVVGSVQFNYTFAGVASQDAFYGTAYPFNDTLLQDFVLSGPAQGVADPSQFGAVTFTFFYTTHVLNFAVALTTGADSSIDLLLYDALGNQIAAVDIPTTYDHVNCDPNSATCLSEAQFQYTSDVAIRQATLTFDGAGADTFAVDNLEFEDLPEPTSFSMFLLASSGLLGFRAWRRFSVR